MDIKIRQQYTEKQKLFKNIDIVYFSDNVSWMDEEEITVRDIDNVELISNKIIRC